MDKNKIIAVVVVLVLMGASFWGGTLYGKGGASSRGQFTGANGAQGEFARGMGMSGSSRSMGGGFVAGEILSKDAASLTLKMQDGSTKIVLLPASTQVTKSASGTLDDLAQGESVTVTGTANSDGSVTAQSVQLRPAGETSARP